VGLQVDTGVSAQPTSLEETVQGAINRAKLAFQDATYSVGLESGLMKVPMSKSGYMDVCVCAIYDGKECYLGLSSGWEFADPSIITTMLETGKEMTDVLVERGMFENADMREGTGAIGLATGGRLDRKGLTQEAVRSALIHLEPA
jgi:inosine/xanthosine triphosphatase